MSQRGIRTVEDLFNRCFWCPITGCWLYCGADDGKDGYSRILPPGEGKRTPEAGHRFAFRKFKKGRKIRKGFDVDHLCRHWFPDRPKVIARMCVNPDHLEEVRPVVNQERRRKDAVQERIRREYAEEVAA